VDDRHRNAYEAWKAMGSPQSLTTAQKATLEKAGQLHMMEAPRRRRITNGHLTINISLPRQGVSLFTIAY
jgi:xylan 1,4-beta-xylosidase